MSGTTTLENLRAEVESARLKLELARLESSRNAMALLASFVGGRQVTPQQRLVEAWGDRVDPTEYLRDGRGISHFGELARYAIARPEDRANGDNFPFWRTEAEHREIVGQARILAGISEVAQSVLENLCNYVIGGGFGYAWAPKEQWASDRQTARWIATLDEITQEFDEFNEFPELGERELFCRSRRDGEFFAGLIYRGGVLVELRQVDTTQITEPDAKGQLEEYLSLPPGLCWKYGIAAFPNDAARVLGYFVQWSGGAEDWDFFPPSRMVHLKLNVDREVKRGMSDFFPVQGNLTRGDKLLANTLEGAAVQAAIAFIREHAQGVTRDAIQDLVAGSVDETLTTITRSGATRERNIKHYRPGTVVDVTNNTKYHAGPLGAPRGQSYIDVVQAALRMVGIRWSMPEYMISGDASNNNFASTLVAESPFTKAAVAKQNLYVRKFRELRWKVVQTVIENVRSPILPPLKELKKRIELTVTPPEIAVRDRLQDHQIRREEHEAGILSLDTWAAEAGRDYEEERAKMANEPRPEPRAQLSPLQVVAEHWRGYP